MTKGAFDALIVVDPQFSGGTATSLITDVQAFSALGLRTGLVGAKSRYLVADFDRPNDEILSLPDLPGVEFVTGPTTADIAFFHHPLAFYYGVEQGTQISCRRGLLVAHHPPFRGDASLEYNPVTTNRNIQAAFGCWPWWAPISGEVRRQLRSFAPLITLTSQDWHNSFRNEEWTSTRPAFDAGQAVVGRHGRADMLKWPATPQDIIAPLEPGPDWTTRVMGCPEQELNALGVNTAFWDVQSFNSVPVRDFLDSLDAFAYFYSPRWVEAFGRTVAEAILMERPCVLDPRLRPNFGDLADYCTPGEAPSLLDHLRSEPARTRMKAQQRRVRATQMFGTETIKTRLEALQSDPGVRSRKGPKSSTLPTTARKLVGLWRRRRRHSRPGGG